MFKLPATDVVAENPTRTYEAARDEWKLERDAGKISYLEFAERTQALAVRLFPEDANFQSFLKYRVYLAKELQDGKISREEYDFKEADRLALYREARAREWALADQRAAAAAAPAPVNPMPYFLLQGMGNAFQRTYTAPTQSQCITSSYGGVYTTNCY